MTLVRGKSAANMVLCYKKEPAVFVHFSLSPREFQRLASVDPLQALRDATQPAHQRLDAALPLGRDGASAADYLQHLQVLCGWLNALDPVLRLTGWGSGYLAMAALELPPASPEEPPAPEIPAPETPAAEAGLAFAWGVAYVVEGSQLGGQVLVRRLRHAGVDHPLAYLQGRGAETGAHWRDFLTALRAALARPDEIAAACRGASWAFDDLLARFRARGVVA